MLTLLPCYLVQFIDDANRVETGWLVPARMTNICRLKPLCIEDSMDITVDLLALASLIANDGESEKKFALGQLGFDEKDFNKCRNYWKRIIDRSRKLRDPNSPEAYIIEIFRIRTGW